ELSGAIPAEVSPPGVRSSTWGDRGGAEPRLQPDDRGSARFATTRPYCRQRYRWDGGGPGESQWRSGQRRADPRSDAARRWGPSTDRDAGLRLLPRRPDGQGTLEDDRGAPSVRALSFAVPA